MSGIRLSRCKGLTFGDITISNSDKNGVYLMRVEKPSTPTLNVVELTAPGRDGSVFLKDRYSNKDINVVIGIYKENIAERRETQRRIIGGLISREDKLYFHDEPKMYHIGEVFDEVSIDEQDFFTEISLTFKCKPFIYSDNTKTSWAGITSVVTKQITNTGNFIAKPMIKIEGTAKRISITIADKAFSLSNINGTIYVDVDNMNVYTISEGVKKSVLQSFLGLFPTIPTGSSNVVIDGEALNVSITIDFANTYIC